VTAAVRSGATTLAHRGLTATLMRDGIPHGVWFCSYQYAKDYMTTFSHANNSDNVNDSSYDSYTTWTVPLASGAVAAVVAWGVGYPADLIKTKIQYAPQPASFVETGRQIVRERGWPGLYHGFGLKLVRAVPASMIGFCVYEAVKKQISSF
jgi:solute carrier family 25 carnitine/acylcarnitine transporter 20/29